jgi:hypothetical protein
MINGNVRFEIRKISGGTNRNIDDIIIEIILSLLAVFS